MAPRRSKRRISYIIPPAKSTPGHRLGVNGLAIDVDRSTLYSAGRDGVICSWDLDLELRSTLNSDPASPVSPTRISNRSFADNQNKATTYRSHVQAHTHWINDLVLTQGGDALCSCSSDNSVKVFRPHALDGSLPQPLGFHKDYVKALAAPSRHTQWIAAGGLDRQVCLWDLTGAGKVLDFAVTNDDENRAKGSVYTLAATPNLIVSGGPENVVKVWDTRSGRRVKSFHGHTDNIRSTLISQSGDLIISASSDQTIRVWSMAGGRCLHNLTMHNDSVWSLASDRPDLSVFYSGDKSGLVAKTDARTADDIENGLCVALCHENEGINKVINAGEFVWTGTANSTINRWADVDMSVGVEIPDALRSLRMSTTSRSRFSLTSQLSAPNTIQSTTDKIPLSSILRLSNTSAFPPAMARDRHRMSLYGHVRKASAAINHESDVSGTTPLREMPLEMTEGSDGLIKHRMLQDRKRVLTLDTAGEVLLWDLIRCVPIHAYGKRHLDEVYKELSESKALPAAAEWCMVETKIGILCCILDERRCFDAEMYYDCLPELQELSFKDDQRVNYGKWILRYLFADLIDYEIELDVEFLKRLEAERAAVKQNLKLTIPSSIMNGLDQSPISVTTPTAKMPGYKPLVTPGLHIGVATPGLATLNSPVESNKQPQAGNTSLTSPGGAPNSSVESSEDYFTTQRPQSSEGSDTEWPKSPFDEATTGPLVSPSLDPDKGRDGTAGKRWRMFSTRKQPKTPTAETTRASNAVDVKEAPESPESALLGEEVKVAEQTEGTMRAIIAKMRIGYGSSLRTGEGLKTSISPALASETPALQLPPGVVVVIQEEQPDAAGGTDVFEGIVTRIRRHATLIEDVAPEWLAEVLLFNRLPPTVTVQKITFTLKPYDDTLPEIVSESDTDTDRLNANRLLRARKIMSYVAERLGPEHKPSNSENLRPEDYLDLYCQDKRVPPTMTLADMKQEFRGGADVHLCYKAKLPELIPVANLANG